MARTIFIFTVVGISMLILLVPGILLCIFNLLGLKKPVSVLVYRIAQGWARMLMGISGCSFTVSGRENIPRNGGICFVSNHGSIIDIVLLLAYAGRPIGFIAKKELTAVPLLNIWILLIGGLFLDRKNARKAVGTIRAGVGRIKNGGAMIIFAEGRRSRGEGLLPFHQGSFKLATQAEAPIVPVAIAGTYEVFEKNGRFRDYPVRIQFGEVVRTADMDPADRKQILADRVHETIAGMLAAPAAG